MKLHSLKAKVILCSTNWLRQIKVSCNSCRTDTRKNYRNSDWVGLGVLEQIEEVSIDLWSYKSLVEELMPSAQVVADRFHVMKQVNNELDAERKKKVR